MKKHRVRAALGAVALLSAAALAPSADASYRVRGSSGGFEEGQEAAGFWAVIAAWFTGDQGSGIDPNG